MVVRRLFMVVYGLLFINTYSIAQSMTVEDARKLYSEAMASKATCEKAYQKFASVDDAASALLVGYKGAVTIAMSKHTKVAKEKIALFNQGKILIEKSIVTDAKSVELKFIRFTIQSNCPAALKYNKSMASDKQYILENLASIKNTSLRDKIKEYLLSSKDVTDSEKKKLHEL